MIDLDEWNRAHPVGSEVAYFPPVHFVIGERDGEIHIGVIQSPARMGRSCPIVRISGIPAPVRCEHLRAVAPKDSA